MIESPRAIDNFPALLAVDGIDVWFIGPNDLAHRMGHPGRADNPEVRAAVLRAIGAISAAGRVAGTLATQETTASVQAAGARLLLTRTSELLAHGARAFHAQVARQGKPGARTGSA